MSRRYYAIHRWLGALVGLQLLAWTVGGLIFSTHDISWVKGDRTRNTNPPPLLALGRVRVTPEAAVHAAGWIDSVASVELRMRLDRPVYELKRAKQILLIDAETGAVLPPVDGTLAEKIARADQRGGAPVAAVEYIESAPPSEYREQPLPAWRVTFDDGESTRLYVDARTGIVRAQRNAAWRRYDFFWMLHTMDYRGRDSFNHALLVAAAALALTLVISGFVLWGLRVRRAWRRRAPD